MPLRLEYQDQPVRVISYLHNVNRLVFGAGAVNKVGEEITRIAKKGASVFLVADKGIEKAGLVEKVVEPLEKEGHKVHVFTEVRTEPTFGSMEVAVRAVREGKYDAVIGLGGGSSMDTAKTAAALATNPGDVSYYYSMLEDRIKNKPLPLILIPTTAGTGSEVSPFAVAIDEEKGTKNFITSPSVLPEVAIVDPELTVTCPPRQTAGSAMDALSHAIESYLVKKPTPLSDAYALYAARLISSYCVRAYYNGEDLEARYYLSIAATFGGLCMVMVPSLNIGHCIAEAIGPLYKIPHGIMCGIVLPYQMEFNFPLVLERLRELAWCLGEEVHGLSVREAAFKAICAVRRLLRDMDLPTSLKEVNVPKADLPKLVENIVKERQYLYELPTFNPKPLTTENVTELFEKMWEGASLLEV